MFCYRKNKEQILVVFRHYCKTGGSWYIFQMIPLNIERTYVTLINDITVFCSLLPQLPYTPGAKTYFFFNHQMSSYLFWLWLLILIIISAKQGEFSLHSQKWMSPAPVCQTSNASHLHTEQDTPHRCRCFFLWSASQTLIWVFMFLLLKKHKHLVCTLETNQFHIVCLFLMSMHIWT